MLEEIREIKKFFSEWIKENKGDFFEDSMEWVILPALLNNLPYLKKAPFMLGMFPFECEDISINGNYSHTNYQTPSGENYDAFCKYEGKEINITKGCFSDLLNKVTHLNPNKASYAIYSRTIDTMLLEFLGWQQKSMPIFLKSSKYVGPVILKDWNYNEKLGSFDANLKQTTLRHTTKCSFKGIMGELKKNVKSIFKAKG